MDRVKNLESISIRFSAPTIRRSTDFWRVNNFIVLYWYEKNIYLWHLKFIWKASLLAYFLVDLIINNPGSTRFR